MEADFDWIGATKPIPLDEDGYFPSFEAEDEALVGFLKV